MEKYGYLLVHFVEDQAGHAEKVYYSLSVGDDPLRWRRLAGGPVLESTTGTTGIRDPHVVRGPDRFYLVATDLRVWRPEGPDWFAYRHRGSRDILVWESTDLLAWSEPRFLRVAPEGAGMAWAPESIYDPESGDYLVFWSSGLEDDGDPSLGTTGPSRIMVARTRDFVTIGEPQTYLELPVGVIDQTIHVTPTGAHRFAKHDDAAPDSMQVFHQRGSAVLEDDFRTLASRVGQQLADHLEGPLVFKHHHEDRWYLWLDRYAAQPQGYLAFTTTDLDSGTWTHVPELEVPEYTKHGVVVPLRRHEYDAIQERFRS
ncbi:glycoside hydrolase family 43 protein [Pseudactinotalea sp.]|uniref:glycoside hydrolase family 43 protein n=1 Tax=Pseudactinotalea sp. TaxID=1926260 RepID=UPI003B3A2C1F